jgi:hypothetical protein
MHAGEQAKRMAKGLQRDKSRRLLADLQSLLQHPTNLLLNLRLRKKLTERKILPETAGPSI